MASSPSFQLTRSFGVYLESAKMNFNKLYLRQIVSGPDANQSDVIEANAATGLGKTTVNNWSIYDGVGSQAKLVAYAKGMHTHAANWTNWFTMLFEIERFKGSTLQVMGYSLEDGIDSSDWAIVGGTGDFAMARGIIKRRIYEKIGARVTHELTIEGFCRMKVPTPSKMGPWGGSGGSLREMEGKAQRLESLTIHHHDVVESVTFTYVGEDGQINTAGRWGGVYGNSIVSQINFGTSEFVKQITGTVGNPNYLSNFKIVTNIKTYGPFGTRVGGPSFNYTVPDDKTVVGFFVTSDSYVYTIGAYTI